MNVMLESPQCRFESRILFGQVFELFPHQEEPNNRNRSAEQDDGNENQPNEGKKDFHNRHPGEKQNKTATRQYRLRNRKSQIKEMANQSNCKVPKIVIPAPDLVEGRLRRESRRKGVQPAPLDSCLRRNDGFRTSLLCI